MKKILGLDLGVSSIGWAMISEEPDGAQPKILGTGVRIVPLTTDEKDEFSKGNKISKNQKRTSFRTQRKGLDRYQQRREKLKRILDREGLTPNEFLFQLTPLEMYGLRARAATQKIAPSELGRVLLHLNQRRGYRGSRMDEAEQQEKKQTAEEKGYLAEVKNRHQRIKEQQLTIGQFFFEQLLENPNYRIKNEVFPRQAYLEEFDQIAKAQGLSDLLIKEIRDETIYYQRPLKSKKNLVSICQFAGHKKIDAHGLEKWQGPRVAPVSSPIFQTCRIWEHIHNLKLNSISNQPILLTLDQKKLLFPLFDTKEVVKLKDILKVLGLKENEVTTNKQLEKGIRGNSTKAELLKILQDKYPHLLQFQLCVVEDPEKTVSHVHPETAEVLYHGQRKSIDPSFEKEPLYQLWHIIYSIPEIEQCSTTLQNRFQIDPETANRLAKIDFTKSGFGNKSVRAMRAILPYLMEGFGYSAACAIAGYNHSNSLTKAENVQRELLERLPLLPKNSLRQPVVEKILNQMIHVVNAIQQAYGNPDEIRVELARELRQSQEERNKTFSAINKIEKENDRIREDLKEYDIRPTRANIIKYRLFKQISGETTRTNATCIYCGKMFGFTDAMRGNAIDVEHIIPQQLRFDDSQNNKTLAHRYCNLEKGNTTAYDYMASKTPAEFEAYIQRVQDFYQRKVISYGKRQNLLTSASALKNDFISRQLQETRFISRKAVEMLSKNCRNVYVTSGKITEYLRRIWGWNDVLMHLQLPKYKELGLTAIEERQGSDGHLFNKEVIPGWTKRKDHRHHAVDALVVACTKQGFIQRLNTLHAKETRNFLYQQSQDNTPQTGRLLERYLKNQTPFSTTAVEDAISKILISLKPGKKVATKSLFKKGNKTVGKNRETGVLTPRGALSEESVYGQIKVLTPNQPLKHLFEHPESIVKEHIRQKVLERLTACDGQAKLALASLKKEPIFLDAACQVPLQYASCYRNEFVIKYPISSLKVKDVDSIIDPIIREKVRARFLAFNNDEKKALQGLDQNPIWYNEQKGIPIRTVRCFTGLSAVEPIRRTDSGIPYSFVKPGNNHHLAFYKNSEGTYKPHICSFWHAVERKKFGLPVVIDSPAETWNHILQHNATLPESFLEKLPQDGWDFLFSMQQNELFLLGLEPEQRDQLLHQRDYAALSPYLYRVQKMAVIKGSINVWFRHHLETELDDSEINKAMRGFYNIRSIPALLNLFPHKIKLNHIGQID